MTFQRLRPPWGLLLYLPDVPVPSHAASCLMPIGCWQCPCHRLHEPRLKTHHNVKSRKGLECYLDLAQRFASGSCRCLLGVFWPVLKTTHPKPIMTETSLLMDSWYPGTFYSFCFYLPIIQFIVTVSDFSDNTWTTLHQRHYSAIPKKEDGKRRVWEQSHLLDGISISSLDHVALVFKSFDLRTEGLQSFFVNYKCCWSASCLNSA